MSEYQKDFVDGDDLQVLTDARKTLTAVNNVVDKIAKIPAEIDASDYSKEAIEAAEKAYNELTDAQKAVLGDENVAKITAARAAYEAEVAKANPAPADPTPAPVNPTVAPAAPTPAAATPTPTPTATPAVEEKLDNGDGKVQKGEKAETEIGTFTAISAKAASFKPNENGLSKSTITIPATVKIDGQTVKVTTIVKNSFKGDKKLKKVTLGANVTTIQAGSFQDCTNLKTVVTKGKSIKKAGSKAFSNTNKNLTFKLGKNYKKCAKKYKKLFKKAGAPKKFKVKK